MNGALGAFLLGFPALFSIVNPPSGAFLFNEVTAYLSSAERRMLARKVGLYSLLVMLCALWGGAYILNFFGISLSALRIAGGAVVAASSWELLSAPERGEANKQEQAGPAGHGEDIAFFPLTLPFTAGPGTIAVAVALGATRPASGIGLLGFFVGLTGAAVAIALTVWITYGSADRLAGLIGPAARRNISRLAAFLLLCVGTQIMLTGLEDVAAGLLAGWHPAP
jgi:multiple antibiotic resistance protein